MSKADTQIDETKGNARVPDGGVKPRPIRKRAYYRALKRGEPWAVSKDSWKKALTNIIYDRRVPHGTIYAIAEPIETSDKP